MGGGKLSNNETKNSLVPRNLNLKNKELKVTPYRNVLTSETIKKIIDLLIQLRLLQFLKAKKTDIKYFSLKCFRLCADFRLNNN